MTGNILAVVADLVESVRAHPDGLAFARAWGEPEPSPYRPGGWYVPASQRVPAGLDVRPWQDGGSGLVELDFSAGATPPGWSAVAAAYGPFVDATTFDPGVRRFQHAFPQNRATRRLPCWCRWTGRVRCGTWSSSGRPAEVRSLQVRPPDQGVKFRFPRGDQFSRAVDTSSAMANGGPRAAKLAWDRFGR